MAGTLTQKRWWPSGVCRCKGKPVDRRAHWGVLTRGSGRKAHIKCKRCHCRWWADRKYTADLPDHREQSRSGMTEEDILTRLRDGSLLVNINTATAVSISGRGRIRLKAIPRTSPTSGTTYRFYKISHAGRQKKIACHRLVWMAAHNCLVPEGYDVDHVRGKRGRYPDGIGNLELCAKADNYRDGGGTRYDEEF